MTPERGRKQPERAVGPLPKEADGPEKLEPDAASCDFDKVIDALLAAKPEKPRKRKGRKRP